MSAVTPFSTHGFRLAVVLWSVGLLVVSVRVVAQPRSHSVYPIFAQARPGWVEGTYPLRKGHQGLHQFRYCPLVAAVFPPFRLVFDRAGYLLWRWLNACVLLGGLAWWAQRTFDRRTGAELAPRYW